MSTYINIIDVFRGTFKGLFVHEGCARFFVWNPIKNEDRAGLMKGGFGPIEDEVLQKALVTIPSAVKGAKTDEMTKMSDFIGLTINLDLEGVEVGDVDQDIPWTNQD